MKTIALTVGLVLLASAAAAQMPPHYDLPPPQQPSVPQPDISLQGPAADGTYSGSVNIGGQACPDERLNTSFLVSGVHGGDEALRQTADRVLKFQQDFAREAQRCRHQP